MTFMRKKMAIPSKTVIAVVLFLAASQSIAAQFKYGVKVSGTVNNMYLIQDTNTNMRRTSVAGFNAGIMGEYIFRNNMSIGVEAMFAMQGFKRSWVTSYSHPAVIPSVENTICRTFHTNIPVLFRYYYKGLAIESGPQFSFCFGGKRKFHREQTVLDNTIAFDTSYTFSSKETEMQEDLPDFKLWNRITIGVTAGLSYTLDYGLMFGMRYTYDFCNAFNEKKLDSDMKPYSEQYKSRHSVVQISIGFKF